MFLFMSFTILLIFSPETEGHKLNKKFQKKYNTTTMTVIKASLGELTSVVASLTADIELLQQCVNTSRQEFLD